MGQTQQPAKKTEEQIKDEMKRKWDNFSKIQSVESKESNIDKSDEKNKPKKEESINLNGNNQNNKIVQNEEVLNENIIKEKIPKEKKQVFFSLIPPREENKEDKKLKNEINEKNNELDNEKHNINEQNNNEYKNISNINANINDNDNKINNSKENQIEKVTEKPENRKIIDYENTTIEKVFHITLDEENPKKYLYLEFYLAKILSMNQSPSFKLENLDDIILTLMNEPSIKNNLLNYFLDCFHRAYEIIEVRFKEVLGSDFSQIHLAIATYFGQIVSSPESFDLTITKKEISQIIKNYHAKTSEEEFLFLFKDITLNCGDDIDSLSQVLHYLFEIMLMENIENQTFFKGIEIKKNLSLLLKILRDYPKVREVFLNDALYNPLNVNGRLKQFVSSFGPYLSYTPLDAPMEQHRNAFKQFTNDSETKSYISKLNNIIDILSDIMIVLDDHNDEKSLNYFYSIINLNLD